MIFLTGVACSALAGPFYDSCFNNYLSDVYELGPRTRSDLEFPREMPGFLVAVSAGALSSLPETRVSAIAALAAGAGMIGFAVLGVRRRWHLMLACMVTQSAGIHLGMPTNSSIGLSLARRNQEGRRLGQISLVRAAAAVAGFGLAWLLLRLSGHSYRLAFVAAAVGYCLAGVVLLTMHPTVGTVRRPKATVHRRYWLYYVLTTLFGARKQIFITFGPWVLITVYGQPATTIASLLLVGSICGVFVQPTVGRLIDHVGERRILMADALLLMVVCAGYGFADLLGLQDRTIWVLYACFVLDNLLFSVGMARATYLKKIAVQPDHVGSSLALGVTLDHAVSMTIPMVGGRSWERFGAKGYRTVFAGAACIAVLMLVFTSMIRIPTREAPADEGPPLPPSPLSELPPDEPCIPPTLTEGGEG